MIPDNLEFITERIAAAARRANRPPADIKLVAVSKHIPYENVLEAIENGQDTFGENYVQEAQKKIPLILQNKAAQKCVFHFIGRLQSNKAKKAAELFDAIETVDSIKLAKTLEKHLVSRNKPMAGYLQINIGREKQKGGIMPENCQRILQELSDLQYLRIVGLMAMPPFFSDSEKVRPFFRELRQLADSMTAKGLLGKHGPVQLSMGMSGDFETAIEEGATVVRIGTAIFGRR
jgi:pyridoxal phosphate enzyme (YggS family)